MEGYTGVLARKEVQTLIDAGNSVIDLALNAFHILRSRTEHAEFEEYQRGNINDSGGVTITLPVLEAGDPLYEELPPRQRAEYDAEFMSKVALCAFQVLQRLNTWTGQSEIPTCVADEIVLYIMIREALSELSDLDVNIPGLSEVRSAHFDRFTDLAFADGDVELLWDPAWDGVEDYGPPEGAYPGLDLAFEHWFVAFYGDPSHPYLAVPQVDNEADDEAAPAIEE